MAQPKQCQSNAPSNAPSNAQATHNSEPIAQKESPPPTQPLCLSTHGETPNAGQGEGYSNERLIWQTLVSGINSIDHNDHGRPWPNPNRQAIRRCLSTHPADLCLKAAREAKEIVQSQDRAPNITALFEKKLRDLSEVRDAVRDGLEAA